jgi:hypothetical protein
LRAGRKTIGSYISPGDPSHAGVYINRLKARLSSIDWDMIAAAYDGGRRLCADMTDWRLGDSRRNVSWRVV